MFCLLPAVLEHPRSEFVPGTKRRILQVPAPGHVSVLYKLVVMACRKDGTQSRDKLHPQLSQNVTKARGTHSWLAGVKTAAFARLA